MGMAHKDKNRDPERARKRAGNDLKCAARKLTPDEVANALFQVMDKNDLLNAIEEAYARNLDR